jgi:hypothetical protein
VVHADGQQNCKTLMRPQAYKSFEPSFLNYQYNNRHLRH